METPSGRQQMAIINEADLHSLALSGKLPIAKQVKRHAAEVKKASLSRFWLC